MPKRKRTNSRSKRCGRRKPNNTMKAEFCGNSIVSPASSAIFKWNHLPDICQSAPFTIAHVSLTVGAFDVATANKQVFGQALVQLRQLSPNAQSSTSSGTVIKTSQVYMIGSQPKTINFKPIQIEYPAQYRGDAYLSIDCLCPQKGWEIGVLINYKLTYHVRHSAQSEICSSLDIVPYDNGLLDWDGCSSQSLSNM